MPCDRVYFCASCVITGDGKHLYLCSICLCRHAIRLYTVGLVIFPSVNCVQVCNSLQSKRFPDLHLPLYIHQGTSYQCRNISSAIWRSPPNLTICSLAHCQPSLKISCKSVCKFLCKVANKEQRKHNLLGRGNK